MVLEKTFQSPLDRKEIKPVNPKGNLLWIVIEGLMLKLKPQYFGHLKQRVESLEKNPDAGKDWEQEEKGVTEDKMIESHHWHNGHEFEQTLGDSEGQRILECYSPCGHKESDMIWWLSNKNPHEVKSVLNEISEYYTHPRANRGCLHCRWILYQLSYQGSPAKLKRGLYFRNVMFLL